MNRLPNDWMMNWKEYLNFRPCDWLSANSNEIAQALHGLRDSGGDYGDMSDEELAWIVNQAIMEVQQLRSSD